MDPNAETEGQGGAAELSEETQKLAALGRGEEVATDDGNKADEVDAGAEKPQRPDHVPEKFWDAEKGEVNLDNLLKSYSELEKLRNEKPKADEKAEEEKGKKEEKDDEGSAISPELFSEAQNEWAQSGELSDKTRQRILDSGVPEATLDIYLAGVAALSVAMTQQVYETAGGEEAYKAALTWAGKNWTAGKIEKFDNGLDDPDLRESLVKGLMADYIAANPGEGTQTRATGGAGAGDVYTSHDEFQQDLAKADEANDQVARKKAVEKLARSRKAKSLRTEQSRPGLSRFA